MRFKSIFEQRCSNRNLHGILYCQRIVLYYNWLHLIRSLAQWIRARLKFVIAHFGLSETTLFAEEVERVIQSISNFQSASLLQNHRTVSIDFTEP